MNSKLDYLQATIESLRTILIDNAIVDWLDNPVPALGYATPIEAIINGDGADVLAVAESYKVPVY